MHVIVYSIFNPPRRTDFCTVDGSERDSKRIDVSGNEPIIHSDVARSNQCELSVTKGGRHVDSDIKFPCARRLLQCAREAGPHFPQGLRSGSCQDALLTSFVFTASLLPDRVTGLVMADLSQDSDEWSTFDHVVEMKHCVFIAIGEAVAHKMEQFALAKKKYSEF